MSITPKVIWYYGEWDRDLLDIAVERCKAINGKVKPCCEYPFIEWALCRNYLFRAGVYEDFSCDGSDISKELFKDKTYYVSELCKPFDRCRIIDYSEYKISCEYIIIYSDEPPRKRLMKSDSEQKELILNAITEVYHCWKEGDSCKVEEEKLPEDDYYYYYNN